MGRKGYPAEFRRRALDLVAAGNPVREVARLVAVSYQSIYSWRRQEQIDNGELPGLSSRPRLYVGSMLLRWRDPGSTQLGGRVSPTWARGRSS